MGKNRWKTGFVVDVVPKKYYVLNNSFDVQVQIEGKLICRECEKVKLVEKCSTPVTIFLILRIFFSISNTF